MQREDFFRLTVHMVCSLDGYVAKPDNSTGWFESSSIYEKGFSAPDPNEFLKAIDCYVMGSRTYEHALALSGAYGWPYGDKPTFVVTKRNLPVDRHNVELFSGTPETLVNDLLKPVFRHAWLAGGPELAGSFIRLGLAGEIRISVLPILLGEGVHFFHHIGRERALQLRDVTPYKNGMVELSYTVVY